MRDGLQFAYSVVKNGRGEIALRPQLPLLFTYREQPIEAVGLLDTGADVNVLPYQLGIALGAVWAEQQTVIQLSGNLANYDARGIIVSATIGQFAPVRLAFAWTSAEQVPVLLGQVNFFAEFDVCFYRSENTFELHPKANGQ